MASTASARPACPTNRLRAPTDRSAAGRLLLAALLALGPVGGMITTAQAAEAAGHRHEPAVVLAPGYADLSFEPPIAGTYSLPPLGGASDGAVIDRSGREQRLHDLIGDRVALLSFIYTTCPDVNGCPLATHVFARIADRVAANPALRDRVRLISLSFDPDNDTAEVMAAYAERFRREGVDWRFLTTSSVALLDPLLDDYDQWVIRDYDEQGRPLGTMSHVLRVYLIDSSRRIRNIYSVSFLHADTVTADIETLLLEGSGD